MLQGGAIISTAGFVGSAFSFDGTNGYVQIPDSALLRPTNLTLEAWVQFSALDSAGSGASPPGEQFIVFKQNSRSADFEGYHLGKARTLPGDVFSFIISSASGQALSLYSTTRVTTGVWYHVACVRGPDYAQLYVNGQQESQTNVSFPQDYGTNALFFGSSGQSYWDHKFSGMLDEVSLYSRPLSASEVAAIYAAGAAGKCGAATGPSITTQAQSQVVVTGDTATFTVAAEGTVPLSYQWRFNGTDMPGVTNTSLTLTGIQPANAGSYTAVVTNFAGSVTSAVAVLTVLVPPAITLQPASQSVVASNNATFSVTASGTPPLSYQWRKNGGNLADGGNLTGAATATLTLTNVLAGDAGAYQVVITNTGGTVTSSVANLAVIPPSPSVSQNAGAVVLVNSTSGRYLDFQHYVQPYLDNFGVPYAVLDIATNGVSPDLGHYALIVIGHSQLDTNKVLVNSLAEASLLLAVSNGTGLVNFDGDLWSGDGSARYQYVQSIFGFGYGTNVGGSNVTFPPTEPLSQMHYITARHSAGDLITLRSGMSVPSLSVPSNVTVVAQSGSQPLLAVAGYGQGRAVQWTSYDWISTPVLGPVDGLDDLVWRSFTWAARKPFVMRGLPNFVTLRMDDASGPFWWVHVANEMGFKPWLGLFLNNVAETNTADLRDLVVRGNATTSIHSFDCCSTFFYYDHSSAAPWPDNVISNHFYIGTQWHTSHGIPISKAVVAHYSEIGPNAFAGLRAWGVEFVNIFYPPGYYWNSGPPWLTAGPYRLYETNGSPTTLLYPAAYAGFFSVPGHPEHDGQFFSCATEIMDDSACGEWCPSNDDVPGSIARGTRQLKRAFDSLVMGALYTHEWYLIPIPQSVNQTLMTTNNWRAILQGITNNLATYNPRLVTYDYAAQYLRATRTSRLVAADYDPVSGRVTATLSGSADLDTQVSVFVDQDNAIVSSSATVPSFSGSTVSLLVNLLYPRLSVAVAASNSVVVSWPNLTRGHVLQQNTSFLGSGWTAVTNPQVVLGDQIQVVIPDAASKRFYRLVQP